MGRAGVEADSATGRFTSPKVWEALAAEVGNDATALGAAVEAVVAAAIAAYRASLPSVSIVDHGGTASATFDNGPALIAALAAANGRPVVLPRGEYGLGTRVHLPAGAVIQGYGATLHRLAGLGMMLVNWAPGDTTTTAYNGRGNIRLEGLTFDGHGDTVTDNLNTVTFDHCRNIAVVDCVFRRSRGYHALELNSVDGALVDNCRFEGFTAVAGLTEKEAIQVDCAVAGAVDSGVADGTMAKNITIRDCWFGGYGALPAHHVAVGSHSVSAGSFYDNIRVVRATIELPGVMGVKPFYWRRSVVEGGQITIGASVWGIRMYQCHAVTVSKTAVIGPGSQGIAIDANSVDCSIDGAHVEGMAEGLYIWSGVSGARVVGCTARRTTSYGIIANGAKDSLIANNVIDGAGFSAGALAAIRVSDQLAGTTNISIIGNKVLKHGAGTEVAAGVSVAAGATNTQVFGNDFLGLAAAVSGTASTTGNRI